MNTDDIFKASEKQRAEIADQQVQNARNEEDHRREQAKKARDIALAIDKRFRAALEYLSRQQFPAVRNNGYGIEHFLRAGRTPSSTSTPLCTALHLYMNRGGVVHRLGDHNNPYQADHELTLIGDETTGTITVHFHSHKSGQSNQFDTVNSEAELSEGRLDSIFQSFLKQSLQSE